MGIWPILRAGISYRWNIYDRNGIMVVPFDTFFSATVKNETRVTSYPTAPDGFFTYNRVQSPGQLTVILGITGNSIVLRAILIALDRLVANTELVSIVTPERIFLDYALESYDYCRKASTGVDRLMVNLHLLEVMQVSPEGADETIPAPKQAADSITQNTGKLMPAPVDTATEAAMRNRPS